MGKQPKALRARAEDRHLRLEDLLDFPIPRYLTG